MTTKPKPSGRVNHGPDTDWHTSGAHGIFRKRATEPLHAHHDYDEPMGAGPVDGHAEKVDADHHGQHRHGLPLYNHNGHLVTKGIHPDGESGRAWFHPWMFLKICWRSSSTLSKWTNVLWPFTIAAMVIHFAFLVPMRHREEEAGGFSEEDPEQAHLLHQLHQYELWTFITAYIGMVPAANLVGFAGQELARKVPKVFGVLMETTFGSVVEIILFMVLLIQGGNRNVPVIRAAILGSILANMLLCLGLVFFVGGIFRPQQTFHEAISEVGSNLMLVAGMGLVVPTIYANSLSTRLTTAQIDADVSSISHAAAIVLLMSFCVYVFFQMRSHHGLYEGILEADEQRDRDRGKDLAKHKLTLTEGVLALLFALTFVTFMAIFLVQQIEFIVEDQGVKDAFIGLILVPVVEKAAEHLTAIDEAYDNQMNFALAHVLGASIQTALLNAPLVVLVAWGQGYNMTFNFELFDAVVLILAIIVVGNFLRDEKSDYMEGVLCVFVYILIGISAFYYPNPRPGTSETEPQSEAGTDTGSATATVTVTAARMLARAALG